MAALTNKEKLYILRCYTEQHVYAGYDISHIFGISLSKFNYNALIDQTFETAAKTEHTDFAEDYKELKKFKR